MNNQEMHTLCGWWSKFHSNCCGGCPFHWEQNGNPVSLETFKSYLEYYQKNIGEALDKLIEL